MITAIRQQQKASTTVNPLQHLPLTSDLLHVIFQFVHFDTVSSVARYSLVCRDWNAFLGRSIHFWQEKIHYTFHSLDEVPFMCSNNGAACTPVKLLMSPPPPHDEHRAAAVVQHCRQLYFNTCNRLLKEWYNDWVCYWSMNYLTEDDDVVDYIDNNVDDDDDDAVGGDGTVEAMEVIEDKTMCTVKRTATAAVSVPNMVGNTNRAYVFERPLRMWHNGVAHQQRMELLDLERDGSDVRLHDAQQFEWFRRATQERQFRRKKSYDPAAEAVFNPEDYWGPQLESQIREMFPCEIISVKNIVRPGLARQFTHFWRSCCHDNAVPVLAYHGTPECNVQSIVERGLLVPGQGNDIKIAHGSRYGIGIYTSVDPRISVMYCEGGCKIFLCAVIVGNKVYTAMHDNIIVSFRQRGVLPCYLITFKNDAGMSSDERYLRLYQNYDVAQLRRFFMEMTRMNMLADRMIHTLPQHLLLCNGEDGYPWIPVLFKWRPEWQFNVDNFAKMLGLHPHICKRNSIHWRNVVVEDGMEMLTDEQGTLSLDTVLQDRQVMRQHMKGLVQVRHVIVGRKQMNPMPVFCVGLSQDREYLSGFVTARFKSSHSSNDGYMPQYEETSIWDCL